MHGCEISCTCACTWKQLVLGSMHRLQIASLRSILMRRSGMTCVSVRARSGCAACASARAAALRAPRPRPSCTPPASGSVCCRSVSLLRRGMVQRERFTRLLGVHAAGPLQLCRLVWPMHCCPCICRCAPHLWQDGEQGMSWLSVHRWGVVAFLSFSSGVCSLLLLLAPFIVDVGICRHACRQVLEASCTVCMSGCSRSQEQA